MKLDEFLRNTTITAYPQPSPGSYLAEVRGESPYMEQMNFDIELTNCDTPDILKDTLQSKLEEILNLKYSYGYDECNDEDLMHDGGNFK